MNIANLNDRGSPSSSSAHFQIQHSSTPSSKPPSTFPRPTSHLSTIRHTQIRTTPSSKSVMLQQWLQSSCLVKECVCTILNFFPTAKKSILWKLLEDGLSQRCISMANTRPSEICMQRLIVHQSKSIGILAQGILAQEQ